MRISPDDSRRELKAGLDDRREEIRHTILARVHSIGGPARDADPEYLGGLHLAIEAAIDHTVAAAAGGEAPIPVSILSQARLAARRGVPIETVLRRYQAGHAVLGDFVVEEAERREVTPGVLRLVLRSQALRTDQVIESISVAYAQEEQLSIPPSEERRRAQRVSRLLDGELIDPTGLSYDFDCHHLGLVVQGPGGDEVVRSMAGRHGWRLIHVAPDEQTSWAWLSSRDSFELSAQADLGVFTSSVDVLVGLGEPAPGIAGWRLTHHQAKAALSVALRDPGRRPLVRYADVALLAAALQDDLLAASLRHLILDPLRRERDEGKVLRDTLSAYLDCEKNITSTAARLGVNRNTVTSRLRTAEDHLGPLCSRSAQLAVALRLADATESTS